MLVCECQPVKRFRRTVSVSTLASLSLSPSAVPNMECSHFNFVFVHKFFWVVKCIVSFMSLEVSLLHTRLKRVKRMVSFVSIEVITNRYDVLHTRLKRASHRFWGVILVCSFDLKLLGTCFENYCKGSRHRHTPVEGCDNIYPAFAHNIVLSFERYASFHYTLSQYRH